MSDNRREPSDGLRSATAVLTGNPGLDARYRGRERFIALCASLALLVAVSALPFGNTPLWAAPGIMTAEMVGILVAGAAVAFVLYSHAGYWHNRALLAIAGSYQALVILAVLGAVESADFLGASPASGTADSSIEWIDLQSHALLPLGIGTATWLSRRYPIGARRSTRWRGIWWTTAVSCLVGAMLAMVALWVPFPANPVWLWVCVLAIDVLAFGGLAATRLIRDSAIAAWAAGAVVLSTCNALIEVTQPVDYSPAWLVGLILWVASVLLLPLFMLREVGRAGHAGRLGAQDGLTGLLSRNGLLDLLKVELARAEEVGLGGAVIWLDLDNFRAVNDQFGHEGGDDALRQVGERLRGAARPADHVARVGSDEFVLVILDLRSDEEVRAVADRALGAMREPVLVGGSTVLLTASLGVARFEPSVGADDLLRRADMARQAAKEELGDRMEEYSPEIEWRAERRARSRQDLARALRDRAFSLRFQPLIDLRSDEVVGAEALLRWESPEGPISAGEFISMAEVSGQIRQVGGIVIDLLGEELDGAFRTFPRISMNLSVQELADPPTIDALLGGPLGVLLSRITVEVTESLLLTDNHAAMGNLRRLRDAGMAVALDDFGSGFANLAVLSDLAPEVIKVDASFTRRAGAGDKAGLTFLAAARAIGEATGAKVLAEGIETTDELQAVVHSGIDLGQGYLLGRPAGTVRS